MDMICHQNKRMDRAVCTFGIFFQPIKIKQIVFFCEKTGLSIVSSLDDMKWNVGHNDSGSSRHNMIYTMNNLEMPQTIVVCPPLPPVPHYHPEFTTILTTPCILTHSQLIKRHILISPDRELKHYQPQVSASFGSYVSLAFRYK